MDEHFNDFMDLLSDNQTLLPFSSIVEQVMSIPEEQLNGDNLDMVSGMIRGGFTENLTKQAIKELIANFEENNYTRADVENILQSFEDEKNNFIANLHASENKEQLLQVIFQTIFGVFHDALDQYHNYSITLPITLEEGAQCPTYAHATDAAADLYAADDMELPPHSTSNMVRTGVHIGLPEGWMAMIFPRSSIGAKTGLRLSNSAGIIDAGYRGPLGVLYDNISDSTYQIKAGDRIAQLLVMPSYRFRAQVVDTLDDTDRGEGGFGSSGK